MLNLFKSNGLVNGVIFEIKKDYLQKTVIREKGYNLIPVIATPWKGENQKPLVVYTFIASENPRDGEHYTNDSINPVPGYALASQKGASNWGNAFEELWITSTYLSDRKTSYKDWLEDPSIDMFCED